MRTVLLLMMTLCSACLARAESRFAGFLTFGCGDSYIKVRDTSETWFVNLPPSRQQQLFEMVNLDRGESTWWTLHVEVVGRLENRGKRGYLFDHAKELIVSRFVAARYPDIGESVEAATEPSQRYKGHLLLGDESAHFAPLKQGNETWWISSGKLSWDQVGKLIQPSAEPLYGALIEMTGRVGPPGAFGHLQTSNREIVMDDLKLLRPVPYNELMDVLMRRLGGRADIEKCTPRQP